LLQIAPKVITGVLYSGIKVSDYGVNMGNVAFIKVVSAASVAGFNHWSCSGGRFVLPVYNGLPWEGSIRLWVNMVNLVNVHARVGRVNQQPFQTPFFLYF
jgi:hypothetical protein